jgi:hypothetical protein
MGPVSAYTEVEKKRHPTFFVDKSEHPVSDEAERHAQAEQ